MRKQIIIAVVSATLVTCPALAQFSAIGPEPGKAALKVKSHTYVLSNKVISATWQLKSGRFSALSVINGVDGRRIDLPGDVFAITLKDGRVLHSSAMRATLPAKIEIPVDTEKHDPLPPEALSGVRLDRRALWMGLESNDVPVHATWSAVLIDGANYILQQLTLRADRQDVAISEVRTVDLILPDAHVVGTVKGSPIVAGEWFFGFEHPLSSCKVESGNATCAIARELPLRAGQSVTYSSVIGVAPAGQMRRAFLNYLERERAHPYRPFLHYNSWYDIGYFSKYDEAAALNVIDAFGNELTKKRGVKLDSFLFDDGWDDPTTLWAFNSGFPNGFTPLTKGAARFNAAPGVWMSPWGGYGKPRDERLKYGKEAGFEIVDHGFALSGPKYYERFRATMLDMIRRYHVNQFKIDGTGNANRVFPGSRFDSDFDAAISLISELRTVKPDIYINLTTGTYPSPFWLRYADSIWRGGEDHSFAGVGSNRQQWITYRDADVYEHVVKAGPLFPLNSLMLHGLIYARQAKKLDTDPNNDFADEVHDYFGTGTQLQEMYITPALLSQENWDTLAEAAKWARASADVLVDTHWIGGDPAKLEVYGWASWSSRKGILVLRNPSDKPQSFAVNALRVFELPIGFADYLAHSPWKADRDKPSVELPARGEHTLELKPFEVLVLDAVPQSR